MTQLHQNILDEPGELIRSLNYTLGNGRAALDAAAQIVGEAEHLFITGIGSSWHAGMAIAALFQASGRPVSLYDASELLYFARLPANSALVMLSRSGKSIEIVKLLDAAHQADAKVIAVTNTPDSPLGQRADVTLPLNAAFDHNVSITMYSALALTGGLLACSVLGNLDDPMIGAISAALDTARESLPGWQQQIAESDWFTPDAPTYFLARGASLASCHEARLLWEEAAKAPASALTTGGFRHGPQEMLRPEVRVGLWVDGEQLRSEDLALAADIRRYSSKVMLIGRQLSRDAADLEFELPPVPAAWQFLIDIIPVQLAAEHLARLRNVDCDNFRICPYIIESEGGLNNT